MSVVQPRMIGMVGVEKSYYSNDYMPEDFSERNRRSVPKRRMAASAVSLAYAAESIVDHEAERMGVKLSRRERKKRIRAEMKSMEPRMMLYGGYGKGSVI